MIGSPAISVERLVVNRGERRVLDELSFEAESGEIVGLLGPNGAGKTTTLAVLSTLLRPSAGDVRIAGHDLRTDVEGVRRSVGRVPQEVAVYPRLSGRENAIFFARLAGVRAADARRAAADALDRLGLGPRADELASSYSGGMQRRLSLACGLLGSPPVLLLDEPTVGVDPQSLESIIAVVQAHAQSGAAVLLSTHHMEEAEQLCDRVVLIDQGRVVAAGTPAHLIQTAAPGLRINLVTDHALPPSWLDGLEGARATVVESAGLGVGRGSAAHVAVADIDLAPSVLERAQRSGKVLEFHVERPSLHDAFLAFTGRDLRD